MVINNSDFCCCCFLLSLLFVILPRKNVVWKIHNLSWVLWSQDSWSISREDSVDIGIWFVMNVKNKSGIATWRVQTRLDDYAENATWSNHWSSSNSMRRRLVGELGHATPACTINVMLASSIDKVSGCRKVWHMFFADQDRHPRHQQMHPDSDSVSSAAKRLHSPNFQWITDTELTYARRVKTTTRKFVVNEIGDWTHHPYRCWMTQFQMMQGHLISLLLLHDRSQRLDQLTLLHHHMEHSHQWQPHSRAVRQSKALFCLPFRFWPRLLPPLHLQ